VGKAGNRFTIGPWSRRFPLTELRERERQERQQRRLLERMLEREMLKRSLANPPSRPPEEAPPAKRKYRKRQQEEVIRRVLLTYPNGDIPYPAKVRREISDKKFNPSYNTVTDALVAMGLKK
jgi:hypothetical protein